MDLFWKESCVEAMDKKKAKLAGPTDGSCRNGLINEITFA